jgi:hypothetical protein
VELRKLPLLLLILVTTLLASCSDEEVDPFLVGDNKCRIPCWNSITPGLTTRTDAITGIENLPNKENHSFTESDSYVTYDAKRVQIRLDDTNQIVETITVDFDTLSLGRMVDLFGEPEYLSFQFHSGGCIMLLYYPKTRAYFQGECKSEILGNHRGPSCCSQH